MNDGEAYYDEEVCHLAYWHGVGAVSHDGEDAEESESYAHCGFSSVHAHHEIDEEEDGDGDDDEGEVEVAALALLEVQEVYDAPVYENTDNEPNQGVVETY